MAKLGYTWYPKDWGNSENVFELSLSERGLYREFIDLAMMNDNKTEIKKSVWCRKFCVSMEDLDVILSKLLSLKLIEYREEILFIQSCESRLNMVRGGSNGGKKSKPTPKGNTKPISKPIESLSLKNEKPIVNQIETKKEIKEKENIIIIDNTIFSNESKISEQWKETVCIQFKIKPEIVNVYIDNFESHLILHREQKKSTGEFQSHFTYWLNKQNLSSVVQVKEGDKPFGKTNQL